MTDLLIGIDIGGSYTKVVAFEQKNKLSLKNVFIFPTPYLASLDNQKKIDSEIFLNEIAGGLALKNFSNTKIAVNLPNSSISAMSIFLPAMPKKELYAAAINEAKRVMIPVSGPEHIFECIFLGERTINKTPKSEVLAMRLEKAHIKNMLDLFGGASVIPSLLSPSCCVLSGMMYKKESIDKDDSVVFVDLGTDSLVISIYRSGNLVFMRNVFFGIREIIQDISHQLNISYEGIEKIIKEQGLPNVAFDFKNKVAIAEEIMRQKYEFVQPSGDSEAPQVNPLELRLLWQPHIERILQELRRSFVYYKEQSQGGRVEQINFLGGGSQIKNLFSILTTQIGGDCAVVSPFNNIPVSKDRQFPDEYLSAQIFVNASSLALGLNDLLVNKKPVVNFLPKELTQRKEVVVKRVFVVMAVVLSVPLILLLLNRIFSSNHFLKKDIEAVQEKLSTMKDLTKKMKDAENYANTIKQREDEIDKLEKDNSRFMACFKDFTRQVPKDILLNNLVFSRDNIALQAEVRADYQEASSKVEDFKRRFGSLAYLNDVVITSLELERISPQIDQAGGISLTEKKPREFSLTAKIKQ